MSQLVTQKQVPAKLRHFLKTYPERPVIEDNEELYDAALKKVRMTFQSGKTRSYRYRVQQLQALKKGLKEMTDELSFALYMDLGKDDFVNWISEINIVEREIDHTLGSLKEYMAAESVDTPMLVSIGKSYIIKEPLGVVAIIGSWNYPLVTVFSPLVSAIAAGNTAVVKPSELSAYSSAVMKKLLTRYLDTKAFQCVEGQIKVAIKATSSKVDLIVFTGSTEKGKLVA